jgi:hypothetical protein
MSNIVPNLKSFLSFEFTVKLMKSSKILKLKNLTKLLFEKVQNTLIRKSSKNFDSKKAQKAQKAQLESLD